LWADCHSDQATISTPPNALIRRSSEVDAVLGLIPREDIEFLSGQKWYPDFVYFFFAQWHEDRWSPESEWRYAPHDGWDLSLAAGLYLRLNRTVT
jgi:hypothetical protein